MTSIGHWPRRTLMFALRDVNQEPVFRVLCSRTNQRVSFTGQRLSKETRAMAVQVVLKPIDLSAFAKWMVASSLRHAASRRRALPERDIAPALMRANTMEQALATPCVSIHSPDARRPVASGWARFLGQCWRSRQETRAQAYGVFRCRHLSMPRQNSIGFGGSPNSALRAFESVFWSAPDRASLPDLHTNSTTRFHSGEVS